MKHNNNRGFSLVEMLVAVIILAIVSIPFLHSFVTSYRVNAKSRQTLRATTLAQNEMENFEKEKIEDIKSLVDPVDSSKMLYEVKTNLDGSFEFSRKGIINDESGRKMFDVFVTLDPERENGERFETVNTVEKMVSMNTLSVLDSMKYVEPIKTANNKRLLEDEVLQEFVYSSTNAGTNKNLSYFKENVTKTININIEKTGENTKAEIAYEYSCDNAADVEEGKNVIIKKMASFDNTNLKDSEGEKRELKSIYLFYTPNYEKGAIKKTDHIVVNNIAQLPIDINIIRQDVFEGEPPKLNFENGPFKVVPNDYGPIIEITDSSSVGKYHTNLNVNESLTENKGKKIDLSLNGVSVTGKDKREKLMKDLATLEIKDRIYSIVVDVYNVGGKEKGEKSLISLSGTKLE